MSDLITPEMMFQTANTLVLPAWVLLVFAPGWRWTDRLVHSVLFPLALVALYVTAMAIGLATFDMDPKASFTSLEGVTVLFNNPWAVAAGWTHYLVFDLFVGAWIGRDARRNAIPHPAVVPCLLGTFLLGPIGLALYLAVRTGLGSHPAPWSLHETQTRPTV